MTATQQQRWKLNKEKILMVAGLVVILWTTVAAPLLGREFHYQFLAAGLALCGISVAGWGDKKL